MRCGARSGCLPRARDPSAAVIEERLRLLIHEAALKAASELGVDGPPEQIELTRPPQKRFGDFSTNVALRWGSAIKRNPAEVAAAIRRHIPDVDFVSSVEVAGIGFINFYVTHGWLHDVLREVVARGEAYGRGERTGDRIRARRRGMDRRTGVLPERRRAADGPLRRVRGGQVPGAVRATRRDPRGRIPRRIP